MSDRTFVVAAGRLQITSKECEGEMRGRKRKRLGKVNIKTREEEMGLNEGEE